MSRVAIVDYRLCNLDSITRAVQALGADAVIARDPTPLAGADLLILPGVGHFAAAMRTLDAEGLSDAIRAETAAGKPLLGVCLGMQLLADRSEEADGAPGLGLIPGEVVRLSADAGERVPHMGWNAVEPTRGHPLFAGIDPGTDFYFVHSYHLRCADAADVIAQTPYCGRFASAVARDRVMGTQFHPEKSQVAGFDLLRNYLQTYSPSVSGRTSADSLSARHAADASRRNARLHGPRPTRRF